MWFKYGVECIGNCYDLCGKWNIVICEVVWIVVVVKMFVMMVCDVGC